MPSEVLSARLATVPRVQQQDGTGHSDDSSKTLVKNRTSHHDLQHTNRRETLHVAVFVSQHIDSPRNLVLALSARCQARSWLSADGSLAFLGSLCASSVGWSWRRRWAGMNSFGSASNQWPRGSASGLASSAGAKGETGCSPRRPEKQRRLLFILSGVHSAPAGRGGRRSAACFTTTIHSGFHAEVLLTTHTPIVRPPTPPGVVAERPTSPGRDRPVHPPSRRC